MSPPRPPSPWLRLFALSTFVTFALWMLRGVRLLGFVPGVVIWVPLGVAIASGLATWIVGRRRSW